MVRLAPLLGRWQARGHLWYNWEQLPVSHAAQGPSVSNEHSPAKFRVVIEENYQRVYGVIYRLLDDSQEAEDLTQDTFVNAYRAWEDFRGESHVYTWLYRIAVNLTKNRLERIGRRRQFQSYSLDQPLEDDEGDQRQRYIEDWSHAPEELADQAELGELIAHYVRRLRTDYKEVIILRDYEGLCYEEIAQIVGCSLQAVKSRLFRARSLLREKLQGYLQDGPEEQAKSTREGNAG